MIRKLILWLFGAYLVKKFSLMDLRAIGGTPRGYGDKKFN